MNIRSISAFAIAIALTVDSALAWGTTGHRIINHLAAAALPLAMPAFVHTTQADDEITMLGPELDDLKGSGGEWDAEKDPGHYLDLHADGTIVGGVRLSALPLTREAYDTALRAAGSDQYKSGYLPYSILGGWDQLRRDFAYWRVDYYRSAHAKTHPQREAAVVELRVERRLILRDIGVWGHYVADASQPLHVTVHFNGWGKYPNPQHFSTARNVHSMFESEFVDKYAQVSAVAKLMTPLAVPADPTLVTQRQAMTAIARYIAGSNATVTTLYEIDKAGGFAKGSPQAVAFVDARLAYGASELRNLVDWAWRDSLHDKVGYPEQSVQDILKGLPPPHYTGD